MSRGRHSNTAHVTTLTAPEDPAQGRSTDSVRRSPAAVLAGVLDGSDSVPGRSIELYQRLRDEAPVYRTDAGYWVVSRYADVKEIMRSPDRFSSKANRSEGLGLDPNLEDADPALLTKMMEVAAGMTVDLAELFSAEALVAADPPNHTQLRKIVNRGFVPRRITELQGQIEKTVEQCLDGIETADSYEVVSQLAVPLPVQTIADLLSVDPEHYQDVKEWSVMLADIQGPLRGTPDGLGVMLQMFKGFQRLLRAQDRRAQNEPPRRPDQRSRTSRRIRHPEHRGVPAVHLPAHGGRERNDHQRHHEHGRRAPAEP